MNKTLVAFFSASVLTKKLAQTLASAAKAELFEIQPKIPYTAADLDWTNKKSRSSIEMANLLSRPEISVKVDNMDKYNIIFIGFPIWWYVAPTIINTFLEQYNLSGKTIIPFATSGGSGMGKTNLYLKNSCIGAVLKEGKRFNSSADKKELENWIDSLELCSKEKN